MVTGSAEEVLQREYKTATLALVSQIMPHEGDTVELLFALGKDGKLRVINRRRIVIESEVSNFAKGQKLYPRSVIFI